MAPMAPMAPKAPEKAAAKRGPLASPKDPQKAPKGPPKGPPKPMSKKREKVELLTFFQRAISLKCQPRQRLGSGNCPYGVSTSGIGRLGALMARGR